MDDLLEGVTWFRGSAVRIRRNGVEIHVDPWGIDEEATADFVFLTHPHYDNFSEEDVERVRGPDTVVVAPASMKKQLGDADHFMRPGDMLQLGEVDILAVPAYNDSKKFHPQESGWLGYVFTLGGVTYYHAGDTDLLESMSGIRCDVAFLPCDGHYTMGPEDAAAAGRAVEASVVVPVRWGQTGAGNEGGMEDVERLAKLFPGRVEILPRKS